MSDRKPKASRSHWLRALQGNPALPQVIKRMAPRELHQLIQHVGVHDAGEIMALTEPAQLRRVLDHAVWKSPERHAAERFDAESFINWLEVWNGVGALFTAERLNALGAEYLAACMAPLLNVVSLETFSLSREAFFDGDSSVTARHSHSESSTVYDQYVVTPAHHDEWDVLHEALDALWRHEPDALCTLLARVCFRESMLAEDDRPEVLHEDVGQQREDEQSEQGFVTPQSAAMFLSLAVRTAPEQLLAATTYDAESNRYFRAVNAPLAGRQETETEAEMEASAAAASTMHEAPTTSTGNSANVQTDPHERAQGQNSDATAHDVHELNRLLREGGIGRPADATRLLSSRKADRTQLQRWLQALAADDPGAAEARMAELAYLANVVAVALQIDGEAFTEKLASEVTLAACNLGLEFGQAQLGDAAAQASLAAEPGLVRWFMLGWQLQHDLPARVLRAFEAAYTSSRMEQKLAGRDWLAQQVDVGLDDLRKALQTKEWANAKDAATFLSIAFDQHACRCAGPLLDECPRYPYALDDPARTGGRFLAHVADLRKIGQLLTELVQ